MKMVEDVMPMPCFVHKGDNQIVPDDIQDLLIGNGLNVVYHCNNGNKTFTATPILCDGNGRTNGKFTAGLKRSRLERSSTDFCNEQVLSLVANHMNWNPFFIYSLASLCKKTRAISDRHLWREFCRTRAPRMVADLLFGAKNRQIDGGWWALGKLFLYCAGCHRPASCSDFPMQAVAGHFVHKTRFSRTSGRFFLMPRCRGDALYLSDPCEHANCPEDVGFFRGVFRSFDKSETRKLLTSKKVPLSNSENCPYCKSGVWNMKVAQMIPRSASIRLAAYNENVEYSVCLNGHVNGRCALLHLSESDESDEEK
ncbi:hypothetical protein L7F22_040438 [Adiantum nelumboides]|nr:hypothetical protein [Adiantum nelumboides]